MPDSPHAVSACLPTWADNIAYEEGAAAVVDRLQAAYPRFCLHPFVRQLVDSLTAGTGRAGLVFPSERVAERAIDYVARRGGDSARSRMLGDGRLTLVTVSPDHYSILKEYWQHAGEVVSSRAAEACLSGRPVTFTETPGRQSIRRRISRLQGVAESDVFLGASGMSSIASAWRAVREIFPESPTVQFGFPYVDTLKIQQRFHPTDYTFLPAGNSAELDRLESLLKSAKIAAVFCETPTNPLLTCPDLVRLRRLADQHGFILIVDDTLGACLNLNVLPYADMVVTSLTKYFSGRGDVLAGSLVINPSGRHADRLRKVIVDDFEELLCDMDAEVLLENSNDLEQRVKMTNSSAERLALFLAAHPAVERVYHPAVWQEPEYRQIQRENGGTGGLMSILLRNSAQTTPGVFDRLRVCKGPNLGTIFTLCCPYTILAHYNELDFVESCGVSRWLLRVSIGNEPFEELRSRFESALAPAGRD
ncbi:MAG: PLP-dependent transferase [Planctomyces sp.]|nr:PLP-dependent transferase [Planctomyces sp.]